MKGLVNPLAHGLASLAVQGTAAYLLGWPPFSPISFLAALVALLPDVAGDVPEVPLLHSPAAIIIVYVTLVWATVVGWGSGLIPTGLVSAVFCAGAVGLLSHVLLDGLAGSFHGGRRAGLDATVDGLSLVTLVALLLVP